jgi:hypothetical protein
MFCDDDGPAEFIQTLRATDPDEAIAMIRYRIKKITRHHFQG